MKKILAVVAACALAVGLAACKGESAVFNPANEITLISREDGSGTRGAFVELFGLAQPDAAGEMVDKTSLESNITSSTSVVMLGVAGDPYAIGYISLGSMNDTVKALHIDGAAPTAENVSNGSYQIARPFNIATRPAPGAAAEGFIRFILSEEGQRIVEKTGYVPMANAVPFSGERPAGKVVVAGSSSVAPLMEKLKEAYLVLNPAVNIEIQQSDSTTGIASAASGICDIAMASRELKKSEEAKGLVPQIIARDGIVLIVNNQNPIHNLTSEQVREIYSGQFLRWSDVE